MSMESRTEAPRSRRCPPALRTVGGPVALLGSMAALAMACTNKPASSQADAGERCDAEATASACDAEATSPDVADASSDPMSPDLGPADVVSETDAAIEDTRLGDRSDARDGGGRGPPDAADAGCYRD